MSDGSLAMRFLDAFSQIESVFKSWNETTRSYSFSNYVHHYAKTHPLIKRYRDDLLEYSQLRNAIVHDRAGDNEVIAEPHEEVVLDIERIALKLTNPPLLTSLKFGKLETCQQDDTLIDVMHQMNQTGFYQLPILDGVMVVGLINQIMIMDYIVTHIEGEVINLEDVKIKDLMSTKRKAEYELIYEDTQILEVLDLFYKYQDEGRYLAATIILNEQSKKEGPIGILTSKDIPRLLHEQQNNN